MYRRFRDDTPPATDTEHDFVNLVNELLRLMEASELFTFVFILKCPVLITSRNELCETLPTIEKQAVPAKQSAAPVAVQS